MILKRYINLEILKTSVGILTVLVLIFISSKFIHYIQLAVDGTISSIAVFKLVALEIPIVAGFLLPLSFFIATLLTFGRLYSENEMAVIKSAGVSDYQLIKNILSLGLGLAICAGLLSLWINPWASQTSQLIKAEEQSAAKLGIFLPGRFKENDDKSGVLFVESKSSSGEISNLFAVSGLTEDSNQLKIEVAASGKLSQKTFEESDNNSQDEQNYVVLQNGINYLLNLDTNKWHITEYEEYYMQVEKKENDSLITATKALSTFDLINSVDLKTSAELHWRLSAPIAVIILVFMAVPLARAKPRKDKFSRLFPSIMSYMVYALLLLEGRKIIEQGKVPEYFGFWWIHLLAIFFCIFVFNLPKILVFIQKRRNYA